MYPKMAKLRLSMQYNSIYLCSCIYDNHLCFRLHVYFPLSLHRISVGSTQLMSFHVVIIAHKSVCPEEYIMNFLLSFQQFLSNYMNLRKLPKKKAGRVQQFNSDFIDGRRKAQISENSIFFFFGVNNPRCLKSNLKKSSTIQFL